MPIIKSAKKKMRQDKKRTVQNKQYETAYKRIIEKVKKHKKGNKTADLLKQAYKVIDKAAKKNIIHKNKANRLKSSIARTLSRSK